MNYEQLYINLANVCWYAVMAQHNVELKQYFQASSYLQSKHDDVMLGSTLVQGPFLRISIYQIVRKNGEH